MNFSYHYDIIDPLDSKRRTFTGPVSTALLGILIVCLMASSASAQETPDQKGPLKELNAEESQASLIEGVLIDNDWRPLSKMDANTDGILDAPLLALCPAELSPCPANHGVYDRDPYFRIARGSDGSLKMISDSDLMADVRVNTDGSIRIQFSDGTSGSIEINSQRCSSFNQEVCLEISGVPNDIDLADGLYVWRSKEREKNLKPTLSTGDIFVEKPPVLRTALRCFDITKLDVETVKILETGRCSKNIFADADPVSKEYTVETFDDGKNFAMPYGFRYVSVPAGNASQATKIIENESELKSSDTQSFGWKTGLNLGFIDFSVQHNETTQRRAEELYKQKLVYARHDYIQSRYALVLDKWNVRLNEDFKSAINALRINTDKRSFDSFIANWGTHYTFATTVGEHGSRVSKITEFNAIAIKEEGVNVSSGASVGVSVPLEEFDVPGSAGGSAGADGGSASSNYAKMSSILGNDVGVANCVGGSTCNGDHASGSGPFVPILLDLRPISDLLGPPFFNEIEVIELAALRSKLATAIAEYTMNKQPLREEPAAQFIRISGVKFGSCARKNVIQPGQLFNRNMLYTALRPSECSVDNLTFSLSNGVRTSAITLDQNSVLLLPFSGESVEKELQLNAQFSISNTKTTGQGGMDSRTFSPNQEPKTVCLSANSDSGVLLIEAKVELLTGAKLLDPQDAAPKPDPAASNNCLWGG